MAFINGRNGLISIAVILTAIVCLVSAQEPGFCQRFGQTSAVIGSKIYYDGGWWAKTAAKGGVNHGDERVTTLYTLDTSISWDVSDVQFGQAAKNVPNDHLAENGVMFADTSTLHEYNPQSTSEWKFDTTVAGSQWDEVESPTVKDLTAGGPSNLPIGSAGYTQGGGFGYSVGGAGKEPATSSVLQYSFKDGSITNLTGSASGPVTQSSLVYLPGLGSSGALISFGGIDATGTPLPPKIIEIFDIGNKTWYSQNTSGEITSSLISGSAVLVSAQDASSYSIYVYNPDGVHILSLPSFTWFSPQIPQPNAPWARQRPSTNIAGNRQVILYGGQGPTNCDNSSHPLYVFDTTAIAWKDMFNANAAAYEVPGLVVQVIGGTGKGGATKKQPAGGWNEKALGDLFNNIKVPAASQSPSTQSDSSLSGTVKPSATTANSSPTATPDTKASAISKDLPVWATALIAVCIGLLLTAGFVIIFLVFRRRGQERRYQKAEEARRIKQLEETSSLELPAEERPTPELPSEVTHFELASLARTKTKKVTENTLELVGDTTWTSVAGRSMLASARRSIASFRSTETRSTAAAWSKDEEALPTLPPPLPTKG